MALRIIYEAFASEFREAMAEKYGPIAIASTGAAREGGDIFKTLARSAIRGQGFSTRWANAFRVDVFPKGGKKSASPAIFGYHKIPYAGVFDKPTTIRGAPTLWLPLRSTPKKVHGERVDPEILEQEGVKLFPISIGGRPFLATRVRMDAARASGRVSLSLLQRGTGATTRTGRRRRGTLRTVPLFVGLPTVSLTKRFGIAEIARGVSDRLPGLYEKHFPDEQ